MDKSHHTKGKAYKVLVTVFGVCKCVAYLFLMYYQNSSLLLKVSSWNVCWLINYGWALLSSVYLSGLWKGLQQEASTEGTCVWAHPGPALPVSTNRMLLLLSLFDISHYVLCAVIQLYRHWMHKGVPFSWGTWTSQEGPSRCVGFLSFLFSLYLACLRTRPPIGRYSSI